MIVGLVFGAISQVKADELVRQVKAVNDGTLSVFFSDQRPHDEEAILKHYGLWETPPRTGKRGRPKKVRLVPRPRLVYAQVVKQRNKGRVVSVTTKLVKGSQTDLDAYLASSLVSRQINTAFVERQNETFRQHNRRFTRATLGFSKGQVWLERQAVLFVGYYHFCLPHLGLRQPLEPPLPTNGTGSPKKWTAVTPAMSIGVTDHVWTLEELFTFRIPLRQNSIKNFC